MDWNQITGFYHIAKFGSFTRAAETIYKTQSALTHQIKSLESELDCLLFERIGKRKIRLTAAGERFLSFAEEMLRKRNNLIDDLNSLKGLEKGHLKIAAPFTTLYHLLPVPLGKYAGQFPWVELTVLDRTQKNVIQLIKEGDIDFGFVLESMVPKELHSERWQEVETVLLVSKNHPLAREKQVSLEQIEGFPLILPPRGAGFNYRQKLDELFSKHNLKCRVMMESSNVELSALYCEMGLGITFATIVKDLGALKKRNVAVIPLSQYFDPEYIALTMRRDIVLPSYKKAFLDLL
ncbi:MAG: LysR family transcriptional regulator [Firmicutes bacterium HGW-Firmicutes-14]|nr:MAG: LysR family transcriptional regulator [Firmicutes bacterium HGW-Firmicutes-14]